VDSFTISTMPKHDVTKDVITDYALPAEMTGTGEIINGTVHIHAVMAIAGDQAAAGHPWHGNQRARHRDAHMAHADQIRRQPALDAVPQRSIPR
jgi:hypothetical protein